MRGLWIFCFSNLFSLFFRPFSPLHVLAPSSSLPFFKRWIDRPTNQPTHQPTNQPINQNRKTKKPKACSFTASSPSLCSTARRRCSSRARSRGGARGASAPTCRCGRPRRGSCWRSCGGGRWCRWPRRGAAAAEAAAEEAEVTARVPARGRRLPLLPLRLLLPQLLPLLLLPLLPPPLLPLLPFLLPRLLPFPPRRSPSMTTRTRSSPRRSS